MCRKPSAAPNCRRKFVQIGLQWNKRPPRQQKCQNLPLKMMLMAGAKQESEDSSDCDYNGMWWLMMLVILMSIKGIAHIFFFFCKSHILGYDGVYFGRRGLETTQTALFTNILVGEVAWFLLLQFLPLLSGMSRLWLTTEYSAWILLKEFAFISSKSSHVTPMVK